MAQGVGRDADPNPCEPGRARQRRLHTGNRLARIGNNEASSTVMALPAAQMREKTWSETNCRLALVCLARAVRVAVEDAAIGINPQARPALP